MTEPITEPPSTTVRFGVLTDLHLAPRGCPPKRFNNLVRLGESRQLVVDALTMLTPQVDAFILLGDLSEKARPDDYRFLLQRLARTERPTYLIPGNHDIPTGSDSRTDTVPLTRAVRGAAHPHLVVSDARGTPCGPLHIASAALRVDEGDTYTAVLDTTRPIPASVPLLWLSHLPVLSCRHLVERNRWTYAGDLDNRHEIERLLHLHDGPVIALAGHIHVRCHDQAGNIVQLVHGALAEAPCDASIVTIRVHSNHHVDVERRCVAMLPCPDEPPTALDEATTHVCWNGGRWALEP